MNSLATPVEHTLTPRAYRVAQPARGRRSQWVPRPTRVARLVLSFRRGSACADPDVREPRHEHLARRDLHALQQHVVRGVAVRGHHGELDDAPPPMP